MAKRELFTSEQVMAGHPDRLADQLSDIVLDWCLDYDKDSKVACEVMVKDETIVFGGEVTSLAPIDESILFDLAKEVLQRVGYDYEPLIINLIGKQSPQINQAVVKDDGEIGAGDQGIIFGYATNESKSKHKLSFHIANEIANAYNDYVKIDPELLGPDAKTQVTIEYIDGEAFVETVVLSASLGVSEDKFEFAKEIIERDIIDPILEQYKVSKDFKLYINPAGYWSKEYSGPIGDAGVTGRKIVADQYGGAAPVGGGAFCGKDPSKVDRSAAYMARYIATQVIDYFKVDECLVQLSYAIGLARPTSVLIKTNKPELDEKIVQRTLEIFDLTPREIIRVLKLKDVEYSKLGSGCHMSNGEKWNYNI